MVGVDEDNAMVRLGEAEMGEDAKEEGGEDLVERVMRETVDQRLLLHHNTTVG